MSPEFTVKTDRYRVGLMDPKVQLLVLKRLMRFVPALTASDQMLERIKSGQPPAPEAVLDTVSALAPLVADTPDEDLNFVCDQCLNVTRQMVEGKPFPVRDAQSGVVSNMANDAVLRKLTIVCNVLRIVFAPMMAEIAPTIGGADPDAEAVA